MSMSVRCACSQRAALPFGTTGLRLRRETKRARQWHLGAPMATAEDAQSKEADDLSDAYTDVMQQRMGGSLTYDHEAGMNYAKVLPDLYVGSCLQTAADAERLVEDEEIGTVFCLQQDSDMEYFSLDIGPILERCLELKSIKHVRFRINDFDPVDLRNKLPDAVRALAAEQAASRGPAYVHCTAGMGRAPAVALAYMYWLKDFTLESALEKLLEVRPCNPRLSAIRDATADLLYGGEPTPVTIAKHRTGTARSVQVAGLDVGWGQELEVPWDPERKCFRTVRMLRPGKYTYKWVIDGNWTYSADHSTMQDGDHINNYVEVVGTLRPAETRARARLVAEGGTMTKEERDRIKKLLLG